ncbi:MAG: hypothetical protein B6D58_06630 [candidate division Zixibacteria bacterium 4484_95]|nr:MAG: hypothetical protein B6D58_06630 [candidate division Zixibacteria bacterium 4484_95]
MSKYKSIKAGLLCFLFFGILANNSCFNPFAPTQAESRFLAPIQAQDDPDDSTAAANVMANFKYAYENNDIDVYENCLDDDFVFIYIDQNRYGQIEIIEVPRDGISGDLYRTRRLFETFNEIRLDTWIPIRSTPEPEDNPEHPGEVWEKWDVNFHLSLRDITGDYNYIQYEASGWALFKLRRSTDGEMRIRIWEDQSVTD